MSSIQIDTKSLKIGYSPSVHQHQIVHLFKPYETEFSIINAVRLLDTLEYTTQFVYCMQ